MIREYIAKLRKEALDNHVGVYQRDYNWRQAILETIFRPESKFQVPGKTPLSHLHPDIDKLHLPEHVLIADWRKYRVEDHPLLVNFQKKCHSAGLHDPWLRNYAFQFYPNKWTNRSVTSMVTIELGAGFLIALALFSAEKLFDHYYPIDYPHSPEYVEKYGKSAPHHH